MNASATFDRLNRCLQDVKEWMSAGKLKLNPDKTEFILFGSKKQREVKSMFLNQHLGQRHSPHRVSQEPECVV